MKVKKLSQMRDGMERDRILISIGTEFGATQDGITLNFKRAGSEFRFSAEYIEENIEKMIEHESIHVTLDRSWISWEKSTIASWTWDIVEYVARAVWNGDIPSEFLFKKGKSYDFKSPNLQETHLEVRRIYREKKKQGEVW